VCESVSFRATAIRVDLPDERGPRSSYATARVVCFLHRGLHLRKEDIMRGNSIFYIIGVIVVIIVVLKVLGLY
jgi:hypothetical protein